ncbi:MAG TPA: ABC transporter ATP-binding protein [Candidatus Omnitrophota bacterium]|nr:ABC transporter ATP-binding protein [Candidatus Omnitrophota bacterium]HPT07600.1 ABC transporter ATP-binding protein [Candidatus Omnitrophota bacterium]
MPELLRIKNLRVAFTVGKNTVQAVDWLNLTLEEGVTTVLAGESGSGKSVTCLAVTKLLPENALVGPESQIIFENKNLLALSPHELTDIRGKKIAYVFQEPSSFLNPVFSIGDQISETVMLHQQVTRKKAEEETLQLLSLVRIKEARRVMHSYPHQLSGGMNQRVFLAMSLACKPRLLIADEPTTALDVTTESAILALLMELKKTLGFTLLFITHNLSIAVRIADRICIMHRGAIVEDNTVDAIFASPHHTHTQELIAAYKTIGSL